MSKASFTGLSECPPSAAARCAWWAGGRWREGALVAGLWLSACCDVPSHLGSGTCLRSALLPGSGRVKD